LFFNKNYEEEGLLLKVAQQNHGAAQWEHGRLLLEKFNTSQEDTTNSSVAPILKNAAEFIIRAAINKDEEAEDLLNNIWNYTDQHPTSSPSGKGEEDISLKNINIEQNLSAAIVKFARAYQAMQGINQVTQERNIEKVRQLLYNIKPDRGGFEKEPISSFDTVEAELQINSSPGAPKRHINHNANQKRSDTDMLGSSIDMLDEGLPRKRNIRENSKDPRTNFLYKSQASKKSTLRKTQAGRRTSKK